MPPSLDVYVISRRRDRETIYRFIQNWVDRDNSEDRGDEELMLLPLGTTRPPDDLDGWEWEPARTLTNIVERGLSHPPRAFAVYLEPIDRSLDGVCLAFTVDNHVVFGISVDDSDGNGEGMAVARRILERLAADFEADAGCVALEEPPPLIAADFPGMERARVLLSGSRAPQRDDLVCTIFESIAWRLIVAAASQEKAEELLVHVARALDTPVNVSEITPYWKAPGQYEVSFTTDLSVAEVTDACFALLRACQRLGNGLYVIGPQDLGANQWELEGILPKPSIPGIEWVQAIITNRADDSRKD